MYSCVYCSILVQSISLKMTVYYTNFHFCVAWKLSWDTHHQPKLYIFIERILIYNILLNRNTCTPWYIWIIFGLICYMYIIVQQNLLISIFNLFASTIYVQTKAKYNFQMFYKMFTANVLHIIVRYCTSSFLDICWFLLTTDDLAHWLAVRYGVVSSLMQWIETTDVIPVDYSFIKHPDHFLYNHVVSCNWM